MLTKKPARCSFVKPNGDPCRGYQLGKAGVQRLLDGGHALVAAPESFAPTTPEPRPRSTA